MTRVKKALIKAIISYGRFFEKLSLKFIRALITDPEHPGTQLGFNLLTLGSVYLGIAVTFFELVLEEPSVFTGLVFFLSSIGMMLCFLSGFTLLQNPNLYEELKKER